MLSLKLSEIIKAVNGKLLCGNANEEISEICTDSRKIVKGMLFIPLIGEKFDGHDYIQDAIEKGAQACITGKDITQCGQVPIIKVDNTLEALKDIARFYRQNYKHVPFIGVTGSVGKTSTKDMISNVLKRKYNVLKTLGNYNNEIGLPQTVLRLSSDHQIGVTEMGMSNFGEIESLASIVKPETAVITNIGTSHIENLGSKENILKAKLEIFSNFTKGNYAVLNGDDELLFGLKNKLPFDIIYIGIENKKADILAYDIISHGEKGTVFKVKINDIEHRFEINAPGIHNIYNSLIAIAVGIKYNVAIEDIVEGIKTYISEKMRMNIITIDNHKLIDDCYNASPDSMKAGIKVLKELGDNKSKLAILGDMLEMGDYAKEAHEEIGYFVYENGIQNLITLGNNGKLIANGAIAAGMNPANITSFETTAQINEYLKSNYKLYQVILVKGSRGMKMESITSYLEKTIKE